MKNLPWNCKKSEICESWFLQCLLYQMRGFQSQPLKFRLRSQQKNNLETDMNKLLSWTTSNKKFQKMNSSNRGNSIKPKPGPQHENQKPMRQQTPQQTILAKQKQIAKRNKPPRRSEYCQAAKPATMKPAFAKEVGGRGEDLRSYYSKSSWYR